MSRIFNFGAGPAMLPAEVMQTASEELLDWRGSGMSVMEMSHRGDEFMSIAREAEADLRALLAIPDRYKVLFLQGGASSQFAMVPLNLLRGNPSADYINTGYWSKQAIAEAKRFCKVNVAASDEDDRFTKIPPVASWSLDSTSAYVHYTPNETIGGVEFLWVPDIGGVPLVADLSSTILSRPFDVEKHAVIYAGAQKNIGPAGLTVVIVRDDLIGELAAGTPGMFSYRNHADAQSMYNTPPAFAWYVAGLVFKWLKQQGGLAAMEARNSAKAEKLYAAIDASDFYRNPVQRDCRSRMNVPFTLADASLDDLFLSQAADQGLHALKGHRSVGGMRASIYNAMPEAGVDALIEFMRDFARAQG
ncbi:MAG: 3-phosphoserine/phosphohydroxythreonine transaminase [Gammaproteobacteria bacterium]|nr:3-phosphoserine/phosphohydroxythreonine transaminase [Gammaproteobacteria bacterium]